uniref:Uncharacterized protein n=1 Tax=Globodera rostochiensis TaxID=31243 RepID=A0A914HCC3_GLORO
MLIILLLGHGLLNTASILETDFIFQMTIYSRKFILCFLLFQPVLVLSAGPKNVHLSLSQMSLFLIKIDEFLALKCITNERAFIEMRGDEKTNCEKELKQCILKLKYSELETLFGQNDQQQPSTMSAKTFMEMLLNKMLEKLPKKVPKPKRHGFNVEQNVFAIDEFVNNLNQGQNRLLLHALFTISSDFARDFFADTSYEKELSKFGDNCLLIDWAFYKELEWKFNLVAKIYEDFERRSTFWFNLSEYFNVYISWHEPDENISAWKMDVLEQRFVQSLLDYDRGDNNKMEMVLKNGIKHFLLTFQKKEKSCEIEMPSAIEKMKAEIEKQIGNLNDIFSLSLNSVEQNRLFLLAMYRIALHFVQNLLVNGLLNDEERNELGLKFEKMLFDEVFGKKGIEQYYYGIETGRKLKELLEKFKKERKNQNQLVSIEQIGSNESILAYFVAEKLADSIGDLLREGESLALLDWCHKNHRQISMTELAYIVEKLRELLFPDVPIVEWERKREQSVDLNQLKNRLDKMPYDQILPKVVEEEFGKFLDKLFDGFDFIASSHLGISEIDRKLILCFELSKFAYELLKKSLHEFIPNEDDNNIQQKLFHYKFYEELKEGFNIFRFDAYSEFQKTNVFVKFHSNWVYFQVDFKYENVIASELRMNFQIKLVEFGQVITIIGKLIYQKCGKHLWNLVDKMDELTNCSNRLDFAEFGRSFGTNRSFMLANLVVNVLKCEEAANEEDKWICPYNDQIFEQITNVEIKIKRFILKGLLEFGRLFMETFGIFAMETRFLDDWRTMIWKNISITTFASYNNLVDEMEAIKESLEKAGMIEAMGDEIRKNRDSLLAKAGVKRKNISD